MNDQRHLHALRNAFETSRTLSDRVRFQCTASNELGRVILVPVDDAGFVFRAGIELLAPIEGFAQAGVLYECLQY